MDTLVQRYPNSANGFDYNQHSIPSHLDLNPSQNQSSFSDSQISPTTTDRNSTESSPISCTSSDGDLPEEGDFSDACLRYINQMLMEEEELENKPCMFHDCSALQAAEKPFYDVLGKKYPPSPNHETLDDDDDCSRTFSRSSQNSDGSVTVNNFVESNWIHHHHNRGQFESSLEHSYYENLQPDNGFHGVLDGSMASMDSYIKNQSYSQFREGEKESTQLLPNENYVNYDLRQQVKSLKSVVEEEVKRRDHSPNGSRGKKNHYREDSDEGGGGGGGRSNKQLAVNYAEEPEESELADQVLLCPGLNSQLHGDPDSCTFYDLSTNGKIQQNGQPKSSTVGRPRGKKKGNTKEMVDLRTLLTQCAQAVSSSDTRTAGDLLNRIRQHSSPHGDGNERLAYYFANAFEARLAGTGMPLYTSFASRRISAAQILKAYQVFVTACPFWKMSYFYANRTIGKVAKNATRLHIIDFGILYGFQWPCLIQRLSIRPGGPPKLRITGIEFPQPGFRPVERVVETGRCLASYCKRFNVPFEYNAVAKKWHTIQLEDLKIDENEALVVNCLYRLKNVPDDTVSVSSPRDYVLNLINRINPDIFIHGVVNGTFNAPFFVTRFREALFHFSALFDMFEASVPREEELRQLFEKEVYGRDIMNVIACEGTERVERPETYKQWKVRTTRAGFRQLPLNGELVGTVRSIVKLGYHKDYMVDEDKNWMFQGWKGRILYALSCWKPVP